MLFKQLFKKLLKVFLIMLLTSPSFAQLKDLGRFKGIALPYRLKYHDVVIEKGIYDLEALKNPTTPMCYLRIKKGRRVICLVEGERLDYEVRAGDRMTDPSIPDSCTLKMKKNPEEKVLYFVVETGRSSRFPFLLLRFKLEYEE